MKTASAEALAFDAAPSGDFLINDANGLTLRKFSTTFQIQRGLGDTLVEVTSYSGNTLNAAIAILAAWDAMTGNTESHYA